MNAFVTNAAGAVIQLPAPLNFELEYGTGTPCDSFLLRCPWLETQTVGLESWTLFHAEQDGARVFTGVVDEVEISLTGQGCLLELSGRGMAARLLDNEALGQDYQLACVEDILREHVTPYGIETVVTAQIPHAQQFRVDTGSSEWTVLDEFARRRGGVTPRFDVWGRLVLGDWADDSVLLLDDSIPVTAAVLRDRRCGVLSEILVRDRYSGQTQPVRNELFCAQGGMARRVLTMPGRADGSAMGDEGAFQLRESERERRELELTVALPFYAMPGRLVRVERSGFGWNGTYRVARSTAGMDEDGYWTRLTLRLPERV